MARSRPQSRSDVQWSKRQQIPDAQIVDAADQYETACKFLDAQPPESGVLHPLMNSGAVAIELYLKSLSAERIYTPDPMMPEASIVNAVASIAGHPLDQLYDAISDDVRTKLDEAFDAQLRVKLSGSLVDALKEIDGVFMASRYPYEPAMRDLLQGRLALVLSLSGFMREFVHAMRTTVTVEWS